MDIYRREENVRTLNLVKAKYDELHPPSVPMSFKKSEFLVENPKHHTKSEILDKLKRDARLKCGLTAVGEMSISKPIDSMIPSLAFSIDPKFRTSVELKEAIKSKKMRNEDKINLKNLQTHKDIVLRIQDKEDALFRMKEMER